VGQIAVRSIADKGDNSKSFGLEDPRKGRIKKNRMAISYLELNVGKKPKEPRGGGRGTERGEKRIPRRFWSLKSSS